MKKCRIPSVVSLPTIGLADLKNLEVRPSGPDDLLGLSFLNTLKISYAVGTADIRALVV